MKNAKRQEGKENQVKQEINDVQVVNISNAMVGVEAFENRMRRQLREMDIKKDIIHKATVRHPKGITMDALSVLVGIPVRNLVPLVRYLVHEGKLFTVGNTAPACAGRFSHLWVDKNTVVSPHKQ